MLVEYRVFNLKSPKTFYANKFNMSTARNMTTVRLVKFNMATISGNIIFIAALTEWQHDSVRGSSSKLQGREVRRPWCP